MRLKQWGAAGIVILAMSMWITGPVFAGDLDLPDAPGSTMCTLEQIYERLEALETRIDEGGTPPPTTARAPHLVMHLPPDDIRLKIQYFYTIAVKLSICSIEQNKFVEMLGGDPLEESVNLS